MKMAPGEIADFGAEQRFALDCVERNARAIATLSDSIFYFGELGMQEYETAKLMTDAPGKGRLSRSSAAFPAFRPASARPTGSGAPVIAIHTEYDAMPDNSQASGVTEQTPIVEGAPGHCEGHNVNAAVLVASALAARPAMERFGLNGHAQGVRRAGRGAADQPPLFRARRLVRRRRCRLPRPHRRRVQRRATGSCSRR